MVLPEVPKKFRGGGGGLQPKKKPNATANFKFGTVFFSVFFRFFWFFFGLSVLLGSSWPPKISLLT